ncbi:MAG TPA: hypothetical protein VI410_11750, partial [Anaerolineales bacterium]|nr:hypothetical protein [Anaerolineales bacterium]
MLIGLIVAAVVILAVILVVVGIKAPDAEDPIQARLAEFGTSDEIITLEELELSQNFSQRIVFPIFNRIGQLASRFTPQATMEVAKKRIEMA